MACPKCGSGAGPAVGSICSQCQEINHLKQLLADALLLLEDAKTDARRYHYVKHKLAYGVEQDGAMTQWKFTSLPSSETSLDAALDNMLRMYD